MYKSSPKVFNGKSNENSGKQYDHNEEFLDNNLYSRQIYALGISAMNNLRLANVLISGMSSVGVEIAKNLILGGVRNVTIHDTKNVIWHDLSAQVFFFKKRKN